MLHSYRPHLALVVFALSLPACGETPERGALPVPAPAPVVPAAPAAPAAHEPTAAPTPPPAPAEPQPDHTTPGLANARALPVGAEVAIDVTCEGGPMYLGPFAFTQHGQSVSFTSWHTEDAQTCVGGSWVDASGALVSVAGFGCADAGNRAESTNTFEYQPDNGGPNTTPVFLQLAFTGDPTPPTTCPPSRVHVTRTR